MDRDAESEDESQTCDKDNSVKLGADEPAARARSPGNG
jgi:hypothetical protein